MRFGSKAPGLPKMYPGVGILQVSWRALILSLTGVSLLAAKACLWPCPPPPPGAPVLQVLLPPLLSAKKWGVKKELRPQFERAAYVPPLKTPKLEIPHDFGALSHFQGGLSRLKALQMQFISAILLGSLMLYAHVRPYKARQAAALCRERSVLRIHLLWTKGSHRISIILEGSPEFCQRRIFATGSHLIGMNAATILEGVPTTHSLATGQERQI